MQLLQQSNLKQFLAFLPQIKDQISDWRLISISLADENSAGIFYVAKKLQDLMTAREGRLLICNAHELLALVKTGQKTSASVLQQEIRESFPDYACTIDVVETTSEGLQKIKIRFQPGRDNAADKGALISREKEKRTHNVILVADDDMFMRSLVKKVLEPHGALTMLEDGKEVADTYLKILPDVVYLDIHLPYKSGIEILEEILSHDPGAYVVMLSSDSVRDNVLHAQKIGAKGFVAKPFSREKLEEFLWNCPTIKRKG